MKSSCTITYNHLALKLQIRAIKSVNSTLILCSNFFARLLPRFLIWLQNVNQRGVQANLGRLFWKWKRFCWEKEVWGRDQRRNSLQFLQPSKHRVNHRNDIQQLSWIDSPWVISTWNLTTHYGGNVDIHARDCGDCGGCVGGVLMDNER